MKRRGGVTMIRICLINNVTRSRAGSIVALAGPACYRPSPSSSNAQTLLITPQLVAVKTHELNLHHPKHCCGLISGYHTAQYWLAGVNRISVKLENILLPSQFTALFLRSSPYILIRTVVP
jgi:hypothetical protein